VPREEIAATLRGELLRLGLDLEAELDLGPLAPPMVPPGAALRLAVEAVSFDAGTGRFAGTLAVTAEGMPVLRQRIAGRALPTLPVVVATRRLALGEVVGPGDARVVRLRAERVRPGAANRLEQVVGQQLHRPVGSDMPFQRTDLAAPALVEKNALVTMVVEAPGLSLTAQGRALEAAPRGALVPVMNLASRTVVEGQVTGPGRVRVVLGAAPLRRETE
jgi:flagella basal body P-ring formation protein FlgA